MMKTAKSLVNEECNYEAISRKKHRVLTMAISFLLHLINVNGFEAAVYEHTSADR